MNKRAATKTSSERTNHYVDFFLHILQHGLVGDGDALEHMVCRVVHRGRGADEINMGEAT